MVSKNSLKRPRIAPVIAVSSKWSLRRTATAVPTNVQ